MSFMTTVLADCPTCEAEREVKIKDCDGCFEKYLDAGGVPNDYDELDGCPHLVCLTCGIDLDE